MSNMTKNLARAPSLASPLPLTALLVSGALIAGGCSTSREVTAAKPAIDTKVVKSHDGSSLQFLADAMADKGKYDAAIPLYRRAHALHPRDAGPLFGLGKSLAALGANSEALEALQAAHDRDEKDPEIQVKLADLYVATSRPELALPLYEEALTTNPRDAAALNGKAVALDATGDHSGAQSAYQAGLSASPDNLKLESNYGLSLALNGNASESIQMLEDVATDSRSGPSERQNLALAYALAGRNDDAAKVASIDFDPVTADQNLAYFSEIKSMDPEDRTRALLSGAREPKQNIDAPANFTYGSDEAQAKAAINRLVGKPSATIEPVKPVAQADEASLQPAVVTVQPMQTGPISEVPPLLGAEGYALQIAAYRKAEQLISGWNLLHERYADLIGSLSPRRSEVDFGARNENPKGFFYRLNAGPLTTFEEAKALCDQIIQRGGPCWVRSPEPAEGHLPGEKAPPADARSVSAEPAGTSAAKPQQASANEPGKAKLDVDALVKNETAPPVQSASTVWQQVGGPAQESGPDEGAANAQDGQAPEGTDGVAPEGSDQGNPADDTEIVR